MCRKHPLHKIAPKSKSSLSTTNGSSKTSCESDSINKIERSEIEGEENLDATTDAQFTTRSSCWHTGCISKQLREAFGDMQMCEGQKTHFQAFSKWSLVPASTDQ
jgi:hypothetical protein